MTTLTLGGKRCVYPDAPILDAERNGTPQGFVGKANSFTCPRGKEPGEAWLLMVDRDYQDLSVSSLHELLWAEGGQKLTVPSLLIDSSHVLNAGKRSDDKRLRLLKCVDKRRIFQNSSISQQYNVRIPAPSTTSGTGLYYTDSLDSASLWTWQTMVTDIWNNMSSTYRGTAPTLADTPDGTPEGFRFVGVSAWDALFVVLGKLQMTVAYDPIADSFTIVDSGLSQEGLAKAKTDAANTLVYDFDPEVNTPLTEPATIRVFFPRREVAHGIEIDSADSSNWENTPYVSKDTASGISDAAAGTIVAIWDDLQALVDASGSNTNSAALVTRAAEVADDYASRVSVSDNRDKLLYAGITTTMLPGEEVREVKWRDYGDGDGLITEVTQGPDGESPLVSCSGNAPSSPWPITEHLATPDLSRNTHPLYPRVSQHVQADDGATASGEDLTANASGLYPGFVRRWAEGAWSTLDACWIRPSDLNSDGVEATVVTIKQKDRFIGRLSGVETDSADTRPVYLVRNGGTSSTTVSWGVATANWTDNGASCDHVTVQAAEDCEGTNPTGPTLTILLPKNIDGADGMDPNIESGAVIGYMNAAGSSKVCVTDYLDDKIGTVKLWAADSGGGVPPGWAVMNGSANSTANGGSNIDMTDAGGRFARHGAPNASGGTTKHTHELILEVSGGSFDQFASDFAASLQGGLSVKDHTLADLAHVHGIFLGTSELEGTGAAHSPPHQTNTCTGNPVGGVHDAAADACPSGDWGPLVHEVEANIDASSYSSSLATAISEVYAQGELEEANHLPPFKTLLYIERIDNSA